jgi:hypothetical protein
MTKQQLPLVQKVTASASSAITLRVLNVPKASGHVATTDPAAMAKSVRVVKAASAPAVMNAHAAMEAAQSVAADLHAVDHRAVMTTSRGRRR